MNELEHGGENRKEEEKRRRSKVVHSFSLSLSTIATSDEMKRAKKHTREQDTHAPWRKQGGKMKEKEEREMQTLDVEDE